MIDEYCNLTREQAVQLRDHIIAREPYHLRELATWVRDTGGPLEEMDGSVASLDPMWQWCLDLARRDFDGLTDGMVPSLAPHLAIPIGFGRREQARQAQVAGDRLMHYVRLVLERLVPGAHWEMYLQPPKGPRESANQQTMVFLPGHTYRWRGRNLMWHADLEPLVRMTLTALDPTASEDRRGPTRLRQWLTTFKLPTELGSVQQARQASVLATYLDLELPSAPELAATTPVLAWRRDRPQPTPVYDVDKVAGEYVVAMGSNDEPWLLAPLPADRVAAALSEGGFIDDEHRGPVEPARLLAGMPIAHTNGVASVDPVLCGGTLRALTIAPADAGWAAWDFALTPLHDLARRLGARLTPSGASPQERETPAPGLLRRDLPPKPDVAPATPLINRPQPAPVPAVPKVGGEYTMARGPALGLDDEPWLLSPLPVDQIAAALTAGGFIDDEHGDRVEPSALLAGMQIAHVDGVASIDPFVHDAALRALFIEAVDASLEAWDHALAPLRALADRLGARLAPDEDFD